METKRSEIPHPNFHNAFPALREKLTRTMIEIVLSGKTVWSTELEVAGEKIKQRSAANWLNRLENSGYLKSEIVRNCKNSERRDYSPTLAGALFSYCELFKQRGWDEKVTADIMVGLEPLVKYSSFISACSRSHFWEELQFLVDIEDDPKYAHLAECDFVDTDLIQGAFKTLQRFENVGACFADIVYGGAAILLKYINQRPEEIGYFNDHPDEFDQKFNKSMIESFILHSVDMIELYGTENNQLSEIATMRILFDEILPELYENIDCKKLVETLQSELERHSLYFYCYKSTIELLEKNVNKT